jgi:integrase
MPDRKPAEQPWRLTRLDGEFCVTWDEPGADGKSIRRRYRLGTEDAREAEARAPARYAELTRPTAKTVEALWFGYRADKPGKAILVTMDHTWKAIGPFFGHMEADAITVEDCRAYTKRRRETAYFVSKKTGERKLVQDGTIHTELGHLRMVLVWAKEHKLIAEAPRIERPSKPEPKDRHLTRDEVRRLIECAKVPHIELAILFLISTGARVSAMLEMIWDRVDFDREMIQLRNPFDRARRKGRATVPMNRSLKAALEKAKKAALTNNVIEWAGEPVKSIRKGIGAAAAAAKLESVSPHVLRHSAAVWLAEEGHSMDEIAQFLGHDDVEVTRKIYARFSPTHLRKLADSLDLGVAG